jgi:hypothetical protein
MRQRTGIAASAVVAVAFLVAVGSTAGCQKIRIRLGLGEVVTNPDPGTPEKLIQEVFKAARMADESDAWQAFAFLLHSREVSSPAAMNEWQTIRFPALQRKSGYLLLDKSSLSYKLIDKQGEGPEMRVFVANSQSDMPTPCTLRQDPTQGNAWRVFNACF